MSPVRDSILEEPEKEEGKDLNKARPE